ncbi:MAG: phosphoribosylglycinamide formyltransferase [Clostridia bacterium]|nr:phosphoribosylglycinamide formyltransferase [Clostridia bacterium]
MSSTKKQVNVAVLVSGGGTNLQALIDAQKAGVITDGKIVLVVSNKQGAYALQRAQDNGIDCATVLKKDYASQVEFEQAIINLFQDYSIDLVVLAGFLSILSPHFINAYSNRIINVHPSLIPSFCGKGYYGLKVHEEALKYGVKVTGATVHFVNEIPDGGQIILQKAVAIRPNDTPQSLQQRVMKLAEWKILPQAVQKVSKQILQQK